MDRALAQCYPDLGVRRMIDGAEVVPWLKGHARSLPRVVLLDLGLPGVHGRQVVRDIRAEAVLSELPIVVLTGSTDRAEVEACYEAGVSGYLYKSINFALFAADVEHRSAVLAERRCAPMRTSTR